MNSSYGILPNLSHVYEADDIYQVKIIGRIEKYQINSDMLVMVSQWGDIGTEDISEAFYNAKNLEFIASGVHRSRSYERTFANSGLRNFGYMVYGEPIFANASVAESFAHCFENTPLWEVPQYLISSTPATDFSYVFANCPELVRVPEDLFRTCGSATDFTYAFYNCPNLRDAPAFNGNGMVKDFSYAFTDCTNLEYLPSNMFGGCYQVIDYNYTFKNCIALTQIPSNIFSRNEFARNFVGTFYNSGIEIVPAGLFLDCRSAVNYEEVFGHCPKLKTLESDVFNGNMYTVYWAFHGSALEEIGYPNPLPDAFWSPFTGNILSAEYVFQDCRNLTHVHIPVFAGLPTLTTVQGAFSYNHELRKVHERIFWESPDIRNYGSVFYGCSQLTGESFKNEEGKEVWELPLVAYGGAYYNCFGLTNYNDIPLTAQ